MLLLATKGPPPALPCIVKNPRIIIMELLAAYLVMAGFIYALAWMLGQALLAANEAREFNTGRAFPCLTLTLEFKFEDCWIGLFWRHSAEQYVQRLDLWLCPLPCLPLHIVHLTAGD